jgi:F-type H+-transporting ATPase subunit b
MVLAFLIASPPARAQERSAADKLQDELAKPKPDPDEVEKQLDELLKQAREGDARALRDPVPTDTMTEEDMRLYMQHAVTGKKYDQAAYYFDRIKHLHEQPNPFGGWLDLTVWTIVVFLLLLWLLGKYAWKPMLQGLQKREHDIQAAVEDARKAREEATRLREDIQAERAKIEETRRDTIQKAQSDAQRQADEIVAKAKADVVAERDRARRELESARDQALQDIWKQAANLAAAISTKVIRRSLTAEDHRRFVDEALAELRAAGDGQRTSASA